MIRSYWKPTVLWIILFFPEDIICNCLLIVVNKTDAQEHRYCETAESFGGKCRHNLLKREKASDLDNSRPNLSRWD